MAHGDRSAGHRSTAVLAAVAGARQFEPDKVCAASAQMPGPESATASGRTADGPLRLGFSLQPRLDGLEIDATVLGLLDALGVHGTLAAAARALGVSYRHAWDRLRCAEQQFGHSLVDMQRGRGARLTGLGLRLQAARRQADLDTATALERIARCFAAALGEATTAPAYRLRIAASHDLALVELKHLCAARRPRLDLDLKVCGSFDALSELARGRCDLAGFHIAADMPIPPVVRRTLSAPSIRAIVVGERTQGVMLAAGNPRNITSLRDLGRRQLRFVQRQVGSGTRALFDRLLETAGRAPSELRMCETEEFTHMAVAATVAAGQADAGFGIEAAAMAHGLHFLPVCTETYYLAGQRKRMESAAVRLLIAGMRSAQLRERIAHHAGYRVDACGTEASPLRGMATGTLVSGEPVPVQCVRRAVAE